MKNLFFALGLTVVFSSWLVACAPPSANKSSKGVRRAAPATADSADLKAGEGAPAETAPPEEAPEEGAINVTAENFESLLEIKDLAEGEKMESVLVLHLPRQSGVAPRRENAIPVTFHCAPSLTRAVETDLAPVVLGPGTKVIVARFPEAVPAGGTLKPFVEISCAGTADDEARAIPTQTERIAERTLNHRQSFIEALEPDTDIAGDATPSVSCKAVRADVATDALNGIYLLDGADVLIHRNLESPTLQARTEEDEKLSRLVVRCRPEAPAAAEPPAPAAQED